MIESCLRGLRMFVSLYLYAFALLYVCMYVCLFLCISGPLYIYAFVSMHLCVHVTVCVPVDPSLSVSGWPADPYSWCPKLWACLTKDWLGPVQAGTSLAGPVWVGAAWAVLGAPFLLWRVQERCGGCHYTAWGLLGLVKHTVWIAGFLQDATTWQAEHVWN